MEKITDQRKLQQFTVLFDSIRGRITDTLGEQSKKTLHRFEELKKAIKKYLFIPSQRKKVFF